MSIGVTQPFQATKAGIGKVVFPLLTPGRQTTPEDKTVTLSSTTSRSRCYREKLNDLRFPDTFGHCPYFLLEKEPQRGAFFSMLVTPKA